MKLFFTIIIFLIVFSSHAQNSAEGYFYKGAAEYIDNQKNQAKNTVSEGLRKYPNDESLKNLMSKLNDDNKDQQNQDQQKKDQEKQDQQNKDQDQENKENQDQEGDKKEDQEKQGEEKDRKEGEEKKDEQKPQPKEGEENEEQNKNDKMPSLSDKLKEMNISEEKAKMILEAMKNNEIQYIQQNKRKATKKKDPDKPDW